jgi:hypothetical protein
MVWAHPELARADFYLVVSGKKQGMLKQKFLSSIEQTDGDS